MEYDGIGSFLFHKHSLILSFPVLHTLLNIVENIAQKKEN